MLHLGRSSKLSRLYSSLEKYASAHVVEDVPLSDEDYLIKEACEGSFYEFVKHAWIHLDGRQYVDTWHVQAICEHLQAMQKMEIRNLLMNLPPRVGKSTIVSVAFPAWCWIIDPGLRFLYTSYAQSLSVRDSGFCRRLILSEWYQKLWSSKFNIARDVNNKIRFDNDKHGYRQASSVDGTITGQGGDIICCDDPNSIQQVHSPTIRDSVNDWWDYVFSTRFSNPATARKILVQQRSHQKDLTGHILAKDDPSWVVLCLPMEFEKSRCAVTVPLPMSKGKIWMDPRKKDGELLCPNWMDATSVERMKKDFNYDSYTIASQLQQRPSPAEGGILKEDWFKPWKQKDLPEFEYILQSWDTALTTGEKSCYSACTTWGIFRDKGGINNIMLLSLFREKVEYPDLRKAAVRLAANYEDVYFDEPIIGRNPPDLILIEANGTNGFPLLQDLMAANLPVMRFNPKGVKIGRCRIVSHLIENGLVWLPTVSPYHEYYTPDSQMFLEAAVNFPSDESNDIIDSMSQAFQRLKDSGWVANKADPVSDQEINWHQESRPYF